jgi:hypothetical protein
MVRLARSGETLMGRQIIRRKRAHEDPDVRELLDRNLSPDEIGGIEVVKSATASTVKRATEFVRAGLLEHPDPEIRRGTEEILSSAGITKGSPLMDQGASRTRAGTPPRTQPLTAASASGYDPLDVTPASPVDGVDIPHVHRHEGTAEKVRPYFHAHPHRHAVAHDPDDPNDVVDHDRADHLSDPRHVAALRGFGGWEAKSAGSTAKDALRAVQGDSAKVLGYVTARHVPLDMINARLANNAEHIRALSMSAEVAALRKTAPSTRNKRAPAQTIPVVNKARAALQNQMAASQKPILDLAKKHAELWRLRDHPDSTIRRGALEALEANEAEMAAEIQKLSGGEMTYKSSAYDVDTEQMAKMVSGAVQKAMSGFAQRIDTLNKRTGPR